MNHEYKNLKVEKRGSVGILTLNRPGQLNALTLEMVDELRDFFFKLGSDLKTRVVVLRGEGKAFSAGVDLKGVSRPDDVGEVQFKYHKVQQPFADIILKMRQCPQPVIGVIRGAAAGAGFAIALACDIRFAGPSARFNAAFIRIGLSGCELGVSYFLPRIIGLSGAAEYIYTGRFMDAQSAVKMGMVSRLLPDDEVDEAALSLAEEMAQNSPLGLRLSKEVLNLSLENSSLENALHLENRTQVLCTMTKDGEEGVKAFLEKRKPDYHDW